MENYKNATNEDLIRIRDLVLEDEEAVHDWLNVILDIINSRDGQYMRGKLFLNHSSGEFAQAVLQSLQVWHSQGDQRPDLVQALSKHKLQALARKLAQLELGGLTRPGIWFEVPEQNPHFTGRETELDDKAFGDKGSIHLRLTESHIEGIVNVVWIIGPDGTGKATLASEYAHKYWDYFSGNVLWINGGSGAAMRASFMRLANELKINTVSKSDAELAAEVYKWFSKKVCLFIFHDVSNRSEFELYKPARVDPWELRTPFVLVTSSRKTGPKKYYMYNNFLYSIDERRDLAGEAERSRPLDELQPDDAAKLISKLRKGSTSDECEKLVQKFRNPLLIQLVAGYLNVQYQYDGGSIGGVDMYLSQFESGQSQDDVAALASRCWRLSRSLALKKGGEDALAVKVAELLAFLDPDDVHTTNLNLLRAVLGDVNPSDEALDMLSELNIIARTGNKVTIHRLVQRVIISEMDPSKRLDIWRTLVPIVQDDLPLSWTSPWRHEKLYQELLEANTLEHGDFDLISVLTNYCIGWMKYEEGKWGAALDIFKEICPEYTKKFGEKNRVQKYVKEIEKKLASESGRKLWRKHCILM